MNSTVFIYIFYSAVSAVVFILIIMLFRALHSVTKIDCTMREMLKVLEQLEKQITEKEIRKLS